MADCGAAGTTLDRVLGGGNGKVLQSLVPMAVAAHPTHQQHQQAAAVRPLTAPSHLTLLPSSTTTTSAPPPIVLPATPTVPLTASAPQAQAQAQQQQVVSAAALPMMNMHQPHQQQQQAVPSVMMMQHYMQQQQQQMAQMIAMQQHYQLQQQQQQQQQQHQKPIAAAGPTTTTTTTTPTTTATTTTTTTATATATDFQVDLQQHLADLDDWDWSEDDAALPQGATMADLAAAWAQAEAEYEREERYFDEHYNEENYFNNTNDAVNLASTIHHNDNTNLESSPDNEGVYQFRTSAAIATADGETAITTNTSEAAANRDWMAEGVTHFRAGRLPAAIAALEHQLHATNKQHAPAWRLLGRCHAEQDQDRLAIPCLQQAVALDPYDVGGLLDLGVSYVNELRYDQALETLEAWLVHHPHYAGLELEVEPVEEDGNNNDNPATLRRIEDLLQRAVQFPDADDEAKGDAWEALGVVYNVSRDYDRALDCFQKALDSRGGGGGGVAASGPDADAAVASSLYPLYNKLGATLANSGRPAEALGHYQRALALQPRYARAWLNMAIAHSNLQDYQQAARCYLQTLSLNPHAVHCWSYLRIALSAGERWDLIPLAAQQNLPAFAEHFDFVIEQAGSGGGGATVNPA